MDWPVFFIGFVTRKGENKKTYGDLLVAKKQLDDAPMVIECKLGQEMTVEQMDFDVVTPQIVKIMNNFHVAPEDWPSVKKYADEIFKLYNPNSEYTKLVIVGYLRGGRVKIVWTWVKQDSMYIIHRDAISGYEEIIKAMTETNPIVLYKDNKEEFDDGRTETEKA